MLKTARILAVSAVALGSVCAFGSIQDKLARFSTPGPDRYADGSIVRDGECYALVWSPAGTAFAGFNADGTAVSSRDRVVLAGELALDGRCIDVNFQIPAADYEELQGGEWAVCLVDTRMANGIPAGVRDGKPLRVNRWGAVKGGVKIDPVDVTGQQAGGARRLASTGGTSSSSSTKPVRASTLSAIPSGRRRSRLSRFRTARFGLAWWTPCPISRIPLYRARRRLTSRRTAVRRSLTERTARRSRSVRRRLPPAASSR